jgi:hypothetical protein
LINHILGNNKFNSSQLRTPELKENHKKFEKRHLEYFRHFENKNHPTSENE